MFKFLWILIFLNILCSGQENILAPELDIKEWRSDKIIKLEDGQNKNIYVIEFFATWCPFSQNCIAILNKVHSKWNKEGLIVIGICNESYNSLNEFIKNRKISSRYKTQEDIESSFSTKNINSQILYKLALDEKDVTYKKYMKKFGILGIPHSFIIGKDGTIVWHGHPFYGMENMLEMLFNNSYTSDTSRIIKEFSEKYFQYCQIIQKQEKTSSEVLEKEILEYVQKLSRHPDIINSCIALINFISSQNMPNCNVDFAIKLAEKLTEKIDQQIHFNIYDAQICDAYAAALFKKGEYQKAIYYQNWAIERSKDLLDHSEFYKKLEKYQESSSLKIPLADDIINNLNTTIDIYSTLITQKENEELSITTEKELLKIVDQLKYVPKYKQPIADKLNSLAWRILTESSIQIQHTNFTLEISKIAYEISKKKQDYIVDTYAAALFAVGELEEAVKMQNYAITLLNKNNPNSNMLKEYYERKEKYQAALDAENKKNNITPNPKDLNNDFDEVDGVIEDSQDQEKPSDETDDEDY